MFYKSYSVINDERAVMILKTCLNTGCHAEYSMTMNLKSMRYIQQLYTYDTVLYASQDRFNYLAVMACCSVYCVLILMVWMYY